MSEKFSMSVAAIVYKWLMVYSLWSGAFSGKLPGMQTAEAKHPFYVSVTEINHNAEAKTLEISCKVFSDDIEQVLEKNYKATLDITTGKDKSNFDKYIPDYFSKNLIISIDGKPVKLNYVGYETEKESAHCYFEVENISSLKKMDISNSILYDFIDSEINIMHITVKGTRKSSKVAYPDKNASFSF